MGKTPRLTALSASLAFCQFANPRQLELPALQRLYQQHNPEHKAS
jgi:hypothetical protein